MDTLPRWLSEETSGALVEAAPRRRWGADFIEKNLRDLTRIFEDELFTASMARKPGLYQPLDPRVKVFATVVLIGVVGCERSLRTLVVTCFLTLLLAAACRLPLGVFLKRVSFVPLFTGIMVLPAVFNWFTPGTPLVMLVPEVNFHLGPYHFGGPLAITAQGLQGAATIILRAAASVSFALILTLTTPWPALLRALRVFLLPQIFVLTLEMTLRYIFLFLRIATEAFEAYKVRLVGPATGKGGRRFIGATAGTIIAKTQRLSEEIYQAMVARGYTGEPRLLSPFRFRLQDGLFLAGVGVVAVLLLSWDRLGC